MADSHNKHAGKKLLGIWLSKQEYDDLTKYCFEIGADKTMFARFAIFSLVKK